MALTRPKYSQIFDTDWKQSVELATTVDVGNLVLANVQPNSIDGVTVQTNYRILVKDQNSGAQNGIYLVRYAGTGSDGWWTRSLDAAQSSFVTAGMAVNVVSGTVNGGKEFKLTTPDPITLGTTVLTFVDPNAAAGAGGANTYVQFNDLSTLSGSPGLTFNKFSNVLTVSGNIVSTSGYFLGNGSQLTGITTDATSIQSGNSSVKTYSSSNVAISVGGTANTVVFTASNVIVSGSIIASGAGQFSGQFNESITTAGVFVGNASSLGTPTPRIGFFNGNTTQNWQIDNSFGDFRWFVPGAVKLNLNPTGNLTVYGSILPSANITYDLGSPTQKFRSAYFSGNTVYIGPESISVSNDGTWTFTSNGGNATMSSSSAMGNVYMDKTNGYMGFNDQSPDFVYDFTAPTDGGEILHIESLVGTQTYFGAQNYGGLRYAAGVDQDYVFSGSRDRPDHYVLMTAGMVRANIHGNTGNVIFSNSISVTNDVSTAYLGTQEFRATGSNITVRSDVTLLGTKLFGAGQLAIGTEDVGAERLFVTGGATYLDGDVTITGNLFVNGNVTTINANNLTISDSMIFLADNNPADTLDIGFISSFTNAVQYQHTGFVRDATDGTWKLFANVVPEPTTTVDFTDANYGNILVGNIQATYFTGNGAFLTGLPAGYSNVNAATFLASGTSASAINITGNILAANINAGGVRQTTSSSAPSIASVGDQWYDSSTDIVFQYIYDGTNNFWVDIGSVALNTNIATIQGTTLSITGNGTVSGSLSINGQNQVTAIINAGTAGVGNIGASGQGFNTVFAKATSAQYADLAEKYTSDFEYIPGTVLVFGGTQEVTITTQSHDPRVAGVVTTNPAYLMNDSIDGIAVALTGRVPCSVLGPVNKGDRLVTSEQSGVAQKLNKDLYEPGCIIGKSLEIIESAEIRTIEIAIGRF